MAIVTSYDSESPQLISHTLCDERHLSSCQSASLGDPLNTKEGGKMDPPQSVSTVLIL